MTKRQFRILIVDDSRGREERFRSWLPEGVRGVFARSGREAIELLRRDGRLGLYGAVALDFDLHEQALPHEAHLDGQVVAESVCLHLSNEVPILLHTMSDRGRAVMAGILERADFDVWAVPVENLAPERFRAWVEEARELWADASA